MQIFFSDMVHRCYRVVVPQGQVICIPSGPPARASVFSSRACLRVCAFVCACVCVCVCVCNLVCERTGERPSGDSRSSISHRCTERRVCSGEIECKPYKRAYAHDSHTPSHAHTYVLIQVGSLRYSPLWKHCASGACFSAALVLPCSFGSLATRFCLAMQHVHAHPR